ncbi:MAG TPA: nuclear transport factor 2 family protein [Panacibacter sp.]|nr:nuclear transport factor 2 family protein [Panacibacter sp.]
MKQKTFCMLATLIYISLGISVAAQSKDELAIRNVMDKQVKDWNNGDIDGFMQTYWKSDSLLFVSAPPTYGWQQTLDRYKKHYPDTATMGKLNFNLIQVKLLSAEYSFVAGQWHLTRSIGDAGGYFTLLFRKIKGQWYIVADHSS